MRRVTRPMDDSFFIDKALDGVWLFLPLLAIAFVLKFVWSRSSGLKGLIGEAGVQWQARRGLPQDVYARFHGVTLRTRDGSTQIDHVFVSPFGIFVVETKNMRGWIFGRENDARWTQSIYGDSYRFQNPLRQNYKHVAAVQHALALSPDVFRSVVVFSRRCRFKTMIPANVVRGGGFVTYMKSYSEAVLSEAQVRQACARLQSARLPVTVATNRQHVQRLKTRADPRAVRYCPKCGGRMVVRTARKGARRGRRFWGCSAFPKCRVVQNID